MGSLDPEFYQGSARSALLYLSGSAGSALDALQGHWIPIAQF